MLSRVANSLYWLARYLERAENAARFLAVTHGYAMELRGVSHTAADRCWEVAGRLIAGITPDDEAYPAVMLHRLVTGQDLPNNLLDCVSRARWNAREIRDAIASEMWEELNVLYLRLQDELQSPPSETSSLALIQRVRSASHLFQGMRDHTMLRSDEWHFLRLGQSVERGDMVARILQAMFAHPALPAAQEAGQDIDALHLVATLQSCHAFEAFARAEHTVSLERVAGFLLLDARFPRSVEFCVAETGAALHALSGTPADVFSSEAEQLCGRLVAELRFASIDEIVARGLNRYLDELAPRVAAIGGAIRQLYFP